MRSFDFGLKPKELKVYVYLSACQNCLGTATVRSATVQERCGMSEHTVRTAIAGLAQKGLVTVCPGVTATASRSPTPTSCGI